MGQHREPRRPHAPADELTRRIDGTALEGVEHPGWRFIALIEAALARGDRDTARERIGRAAVLLRERAGRLGNPADRESYLHAVRPHRRLFAIDEEPDQTGG